MAESRRLSPLVVHAIGILIFLGLMGYVGWVAVETLNEHPHPTGSGPIVNNVPVLMAVAVVVAVAAIVIRSLHCGVCGKRRCECPGVQP